MNNDLFLVLRIFVSTAFFRVYFTFIKFVEDIYLFSYQCSYCVWKSASETEVKVHISGTHRNVPLRVIYNPERAELQKMQERCFPSIRNFTAVSMSNPEGAMGNGGPGSTLLKKLVR